MRPSAARAQGKATEDMCSLPLTGARLAQIKANYAGYLSVLPRCFGDTGPYRVSIKPVALARKFFIDLLRKLFALQ